MEKKLEGKTSYCYTYEYDNKGRLIKIITINSEGREDIIIPK